MLPPSNAVGRNRFSLTTLASASPHGVGPLSEDITPPTQPVRVRKMDACFLSKPRPGAHDPGQKNYAVIRNRVFTLARETLRFLSGIAKGIVLPLAHGRSTH